jgi:hypothetical protein
MNADPRIVCLRLAGNWASKIDRGEIDIDAGWNLLIERLGAIVPAYKTCPTCNQTPCPDESFCASMRAADQKIAAGRKCAQCGAGGNDLDPYQDKEKRKVIYLHRDCARFWQGRQR